MPEVSIALWLRLCYNILIMIRGKDCSNCLVQCFVDNELVSLEGQLPAARLEAKRLAAERKVTEDLYMESLDSVDESERQRLGRQYASFDAQHQMREAAGDRNVDDRDSLANELVGLGSAALVGCAGPTEKGLCTGPVQEGFYLENMTAPKV
jgi:hypothetical protein